MNSNNVINSNYLTKKHIAIVGAGASGLMAAEILSQYDVKVSVFEHKPTAARKILMAGKTGLNISHSEPVDRFVMRYTPSDWIGPFVRQFDATKIREWMLHLGIESFVGSTGRIFPVHMKASVLVRAWLKRLTQQGVDFYYRHRCTLMEGKNLTIDELNQKGEILFSKRWQFDAVILACGGGSYASLGSDGRWQNWFSQNQLTPLFASNVGVLRSWSQFMQPNFGKPLKRILAWVEPELMIHGDIVVSHYGLESGVIYRLNQSMRSAVQNDGSFVFYIDLLPQKDQASIELILRNKKQSLNTLLKKLGLDAVKIALLRECTEKTNWSDFKKMAASIKALPVRCTGFRPIDEAISTGGGIARSAVNERLELKACSGVFCAGEMLDWDAPTGGYLLNACLAMGRVAAFGVVDYLDLK